MAPGRGDPLRDRARPPLQRVAGHGAQGDRRARSRQLVVRRQGKGTFVATHTEERSSLFRFLRIRRNDGSDVAPVSRLLDVKRAKAGADTARLLAIKPGDAVLVLRRVLEYSGEPVVLDEITLPAALFRGLTKARYDAYRGSMYSFFESAVRRAHAEGAGEDPRGRRGRRDRALLGTEAGAPLLAVDRVTLTYGDRPVEVRRGLCVTRAYHYLNELY